MIGGLGRPGEHFLPWLGRTEEGTRLTRRDVTAALDVARDHTGAVGIKFMADYLPRLARAWLLTSVKDDLEACLSFLKVLMAEHGRFAIYRIDRTDRFDQALSRYLAGATGVYFKTIEGEDVQRDTDKRRLTADAALDGLFPKRVEQLLSRIDRETSFLDQLCDALPVPVMAVSYEDLCDDRDRVLRRCCQHAGIEAPNTWKDRWMTKVVDHDQRERFRAHALANYLDRSSKGADFPLTARAFAEDLALPKSA